MVVRNDYPILEYSTEREAVINPGTKKIFPRFCFVTFFEGIFNEFVEKYNGVIIGTYVSEMKKFPVYKVTHNDVEVCIVQAVVASGAIAMMTDWLYGKGVDVIVCCGSCGVLDHIPEGDVIIPIRALRDEGASYKYLPPSRFIELDKRPKIWLSTEEKKAARL